MVDPGAPTGPVRRLRYRVAVSLGGFIAGLDDGFDWIPPEPAFDFEALHARFDTLLMGRRTWEIVRAAGGGRSEHPARYAPGRRSTSGLLGCRWVMQ